MARYIDAEKQIERYSKKLGFYIDEEGEDRFSAKCEEIRAVIDALYNAPTADVVEVVHGYWEAYPTRNYKRCSVCKTEYYKPYNDFKGNYCPNCGAVMVGKKAE